MHLADVGGGMFLFDGKVSLNCLMLTPRRASSTSWESENELPPQNEVGSLVLQHISVSVLYSRSCEAVSNCSLQSKTSISIPGNTWERNPMKDLVMVYSPGCERRGASPPIPYPLASMLERNINRVSLRPRSLLSSRPSQPPSWHMSMESTL